MSASHTVRRDDEIPVTLPDGNSTVAKVAGRDSATDLIALRVEGTRSYVAPKADVSSLRVGSRRWRRLAQLAGRPHRSCLEARSRGL